MAPFSPSRRLRTSGSAPPEALRLWRAARRDDVRPRRVLGPDGAPAARRCTRPTPSSSLNRPSMTAHRVIVTVWESAQWQMISKRSLPDLQCV